MDRDGTALLGVSGFEMRVHDTLALAAPSVCDKCMLLDHLLVNMDNRQRRTLLGQGAIFSSFLYTYTKLSKA